MRNNYCPNCGYQLEHLEMPHKYKWKCTNCGGEFSKRNTDDYVEDAVRKYWEEHYPQEMIAFFYQKYDFEDKWERHTELIECESDRTDDTVIFLNDFCEGQTDIKCLHVVPLEDVMEFYFDNHNELQGGGNNG